VNTLQTGWINTSNNWWPFVSSGINADIGSNRVLNRGLPTELRGHRHSLLSHPWAAQGYPAVCQGDPWDRARFSANCGLAGDSDRYSHRSRRSLAWAVRSDELACLPAGDFDHFRHNPLLPGAAHYHADAGGCSGVSRSGDQPVAALSGDRRLSASHTGSRDGTGIAAIAAIIVINRHDLVHQAIVVALLLGVMLLNLLTWWSTETILERGLAGVLPVIGWVLAVLQASLAVQIVIHSLRVLEVLHWPGS
jgi:hypothetical protein